MSVQTTGVIEVSVAADTAEVRVQQAFPVNRRNFVRWRAPLQEARARPLRPGSRDENAV
jgi:hypothetical protein